MIGAIIFPILRRLGQQRKPSNREAPNLCTLYASLARSQLVRACCILSRLNLNSGTPVPSNTYSLVGRSTKTVRSRSCRYTLNHASRPYASQGIFLDQRFLVLSGHLTLHPINPINSCVSLHIPRHKLYMYIHRHTSDV